MIPDKVKIGPLFFKIVEKEDVSGSFYGLEDFNNSTIFLNKDITLDHKVVILLHEILHVIFDLHGIDCDEDNHKIVYLVSNYLSQVLIDNPELLNLFDLKERDHEKM